MILEEQWHQKIITLMDDSNLGVVLSVVSLITTIAQDQCDRYDLAYQRAVHRLKMIVVDSEYDIGYLYYKVPCPWLQIKLMRLLLTFPAPVDQLLRNLLTEVLESIISSNESQQRSSQQNTQQNNAQHAVLFQAIDLATHIGVHHGVTTRIINLLSRFITSKETNIRYLGLETLARLAGRGDLQTILKAQQNVVSQSLKDRDISVRRRALDLLYSMCDVANAKLIVMDLLRHLQISDYAIREEMVLKIAILAEKFATNCEWYVTVNLQLLAIAGEHVAVEVWQRIVQVVANNESLQEHAARSVLQYIKNASCHESLVKIAGFVLGEYGHLVANENDCAPLDQFSALHSRFNLATSATQAILLSTYIKLMNLFPEIKSEIILVFQQCCKILNVEIQQRACEYLALAELPHDNLLQAVCEEMPPVRCYLRSDLG